MLISRLFDEPHIFTYEAINLKFLKIESNPINAYNIQVKSLKREKPSHKKLFKSINQNLPFHAQ